MLQLQRQPVIRQVIFDLDGTLLDTREGIMEGVAHTARVLGYRELDRETMLTFVGPPIQQSLMTHYGCTPEEAQRGAEVFRAYYKESAMYKARPYEGIYELCEMLRSRDIRMAVATYKREDYALTLLRHFRFHEYCSVMHGADGENKLKKRDIVELCLAELGGERQETVLVGDTVHDAAGAMEAGIAFIAVSYGFGFRNAEDGGSYPFLGIAQTPLEIGELL